MGERDWKTVKAERLKEETSRPVSRFPIFQFFIFPLFFIAKGSLAELSAQLDVAQEVHALDQGVIRRLTAECEEIAAMIRGIIKHRQT